MTLLNHTLGFPRIGLRCELKMVAEFVQGQPFKLTWTQRLDEVDEALANRVKAAQNLRNAQKA